MQMFRSNAQNVVTLRFSCFPNPNFIPTNSATGLQPVASTGVYGQSHTPGYAAAGSALAAQGLCVQFLSVGVLEVGGLLSGLSFLSTI